MNKLLIACTSFLLVACATKSEMPDHVYRNLAGFAAQGKRCFDSEMISPRELADTKQVVSTALGTWSFSQEKFEDFYQTNFSSKSASREECRSFQSELISRQNQIETTRQNNRQAQEEINQMGRTLGNSVPKPIYCHRIGTMVSCF